VFLTPTYTDPDKKDKYLHTRIKCWPPFYLSPKLFQKYYQYDSAGARIKDNPKYGEDVQRHPVVVKADVNDSDDEDISNSLILFCNKAHYSTMIDKIFDVILSSFIKE
jgi:hypothetical protein